MKTLLNIWLDDQGVINAQTDYHFDVDFRRSDLKAWEAGRYPDLAHFLQSREKTDLRRVIMLLNDARTDPRLNYRDLHPELEQSLIEWRRQTAQKQGMPTFKVLEQKTLLSIADAVPRSYSDLMRIPGIGLRRAERYGEDLLHLSEEYCQLYLEKLPPL